MSAKVVMWEYKTWRDVRAFAGAHKGSWTWSDPGTVAALNNLGAEGWEAINAMHVDDGVCILFKRDTGRSVTIP